MNHHRTSHEIEREIERERSELSSTIDELQRRFTPEAVLQQLGRNIRDHGGEFGSAVQQSVKQNPVALALTGVGLAWLMFGRSFNDRDDSTNGTREAGRPLHDRSRLDDNASYDTFRENRERLGRMDDSRSTSTWDNDPRPMPAGTTTRPARGGTNHYPDWFSQSGEEDSAYSPAIGKIKEGVDTAREAASSAKKGAKSAGSHVGDAAGSAADRVSGAVRSASGSISETAHSAAETASHAASSAAARAAALRKRLAQGTEDLSEAARERVIAARERAILVRDRVQASASRNWQRGRDNAVDFYEQQPLVVGALAIAVGAALGGALPRTKREDEMFGGVSDDLVDEAERIYREERAKAEKVAGAVAKEASKIGKDAVKSAGKATKTATKRAKTAGRKVKNTAVKEAKKQDLGKPNA